MPLLLTADAQQGRVQAVWTLDGELLASRIAVKNASKASPCIPAIHSQSSHGHDVLTQQSSLGPLACLQV